jgi:hypothetical protein
MQDHPTEVRGPTPDGEDAPGGKPSRAPGKVQRTAVLTIGVKHFATAAFPIGE